MNNCPNKLATNAFRKPCCHFRWPFFCWKKLLVRSPAPPTATAFCATPTAHASRRWRRNARSVPAHRGRLSCVFFVSERFRNRSGRSSFCVLVIIWYRNWLFFQMGKCVGMFGPNDVVLPVFSPARNGRMDANGSCPRYI